MEGANTGLESEKEEKIETKTEWEKGRKNEMR